MIKLFLFGLAILLYGKAALASTHINTVSGVPITAKNVRLVKIVGDINLSSTDKIIEELKKSDKSSRHKVFIYINSIGGELPQADRIIALVEKIKKSHQVIMIGDSIVQSAAFNIFAHADVRVVTAKTCLMFHKMAYPLLTETKSGRLTAIRLRQIADKMDELEQQYITFNAANLGMTEKDYCLHAENDTYWRPDALMKIGFIHGIVKIENL